MKNWKHFSVGISLLSAFVLAAMYASPSRTSAQQAGGMDAAAMMGQSISTQVVTIKLQNQRGEPRLASAKATFDRQVLGYWVALVGTDIKFTGNTEKSINRELFGVDPFAKIINGKEVEVSGKLGIRDGSGDWDDAYEGTLTVAVTAILASR